MENERGNNRERQTDRLREVLPVKLATLGKGTFFLGQIYCWK